MNTFQMFTALFMLFLGPIQVLWALVAIFATNHRKVRLHYIAYLGGVAIYFVLFEQIEVPLQRMYESSFLKWFFFGGAGILAVYHIWISSFPASAYGAFKVPENQHDQQIAP